jgi:hypothetical protein
MTTKSSQLTESSHSAENGFSPVRSVDEQDVESLNKIIGSATNFF